MPVFQVSSSYDSSAGRVTISAREVQPRDSLTGFFDVDSDVEIATDAGIVRGIVPMRNGTGSASFSVKAAPRSVQWDKGGWILGLADFPRSTNMLAYQLKHDDDVLGRIDAADLLGKRITDDIALGALLNATHDDSFWAVRARATRSLGRWGLRPEHSRLVEQYNAVHIALLDASRDADARVRESAADALAGFPSAETTARLRDLAVSDTNPYSRGHALAAYVRLEGDASLPLVREILPQDVWRDVIRAPVLPALRDLGTPDALALARQYTPVALPIF